MKKDNDFLNCLVAFGVVAAIRYWAAIQFPPPKPIDPRFERSILKDLETMKAAREYQFPAAPEFKLEPISEFRFGLKDPTLVPVQPKLEPFVIDPARIQIDPEDWIQSKLEQPLEE